MLVQNFYGNADIFNWKSSIELRQRFSSSSDCFHGTDEYNTMRLRNTYDFAQNEFLCRQFLIHFVIFIYDSMTSIGVLHAIIKASLTKSNTQLIDL